MEYRLSLITVPDVNAQLVILEVHIQFDMALIAVRNIFRGFYGVFQSVGQ